jgi:hypothetical protein
MALVSIARDRGDFVMALRHAREMATLDPADTRLRSLVSDLERRQPQLALSLFAVPLWMN